MTEDETVAFLGPEASYTHQVRGCSLVLSAISRFVVDAIEDSAEAIIRNTSPQESAIVRERITPLRISASLATFKASSHTFVPLTTIPAIFAAVQSGKSNYGVVPFENTTYGAVIATLDSLATALRTTPAPHSDPSSTKLNSRPETSTSINDGDASYPDIRVRGDVTLPIRHCLLGHFPADSSAPPQQDKAAPRWKHITRVYSHDQALGQCAHFLATHLPQAERISDTSTSRAAERVAASRGAKIPAGASNANGGGENVGLDTTVAAISSEMAAALYDVSILERDVQDNDDNKTRFLVLERSAAAGGGGASQRVSLRQGSRVGTLHTSLVVFTVGDQAPGALARCLGLFEKHGLNAVGIQQRPPNKMRSEHAIFVEVQGEATSVEQAMHELADLTSACRCLGTWQS